jgi:hypothetical protein
MLSSVEDMYTKSGKLRELLTAVLAFKKKIKQNNQLPREALFESEQHIANAFHYTKRAQDNARLLADKPEQAVKEAFYRNFMGALVGLTYACDVLDSVSSPEWDRLRR